ncbi:unnamed protein product [Zymoseptoria tritici ST99CH_1A5]|uniref:Mediator of RNA polymerase II transcription subunit 7 n=3 Tax=Zymoseptoria tritici TaxID=1047171 RepID=A0A1X7RFQ2_ZYMT9|nr:unnamed protein product [Zymoseptoria tritici ST99CH_3D7]SMR42572.1 unnamed protein product [Zymoseptoria tritici ST99CH_1E4]SMR44746.1 unnamed protein product [Zymoseptoria tritici ST99CH_3D1]SMY19911.1 unnamed protein product [Zymoseptoria tritici ST99CH_1A5]
MAEPQATAALFPAPPPFWKHFTRQNVRRAKQNRESGPIDDEQDPDLRYLIPPEPPADGRYKVFGLAIDLHEKPATLESAGIEQLYPQHPSVRLSPQPHLISLARSLLTNFLSLTGILGQNPELFEDRVADLQTIMYNMHDLINQYRPHQARETLILMMEERVEKMRAEIRAVDESKEKVDKLLAGLREGELSHVAATAAQQDHHTRTPTDTTTNERKQRQRAAWAALDDDSG